MGNWLTLLCGLIVALVATGVAIWQLALSPPSPLPPFAQGAFILENVLVISPGSEDHHDDKGQRRNIAVKDGVIVDVFEGNSETAPSYSSFTRINLFKDHWVTPGLIDMHSHLPPANLLKLTRHALFLSLYFGITSIRDAGDVDGTAFDAVLQDTRDGYPVPRVFPCGPFVGGPPARWKNTLLFEKLEDATKIVKDLKARGFVCLKSYDNLDLDHVSALQYAAKENNDLPVLGHVPFPLRYEHALIPDVQHFSGIPDPSKIQDTIVSRMYDWASVDEARIEEIVKITLDRHLANTPTLISNKDILLFERYHELAKDPHNIYYRYLPRLFFDVVWNPEAGMIPSQFFQDLKLIWFLFTGLLVYRNLFRFDRMEDALHKKMQLTKKLFDSGATLFLGTDTQQPFSVPGLSLLHEIELFQEADIPLASLWKMATRDAGTALKTLKGLGEINSGAPADLLVWSKNPLHHFDSHSLSEAVIADGKLYLRSQLDEMLKQWQDHFRGFIFDKVSTFLAGVMIKLISTSSQ